MKNRSHRVVWIAVACGGLLVSALPAGCASTRPTPYDPPAEADRNPALAQELTRRADKEADAERAEKLLIEALSADMFHGPAHNNLGVLYLGQGKLYEAASEFEWARKLMPGSPEPRMNLALTLERAGRVSEAIETYSAALQAAPEHIESIQALARLQLRAGRADDRTPRLLSTIAMRGTTEEWRDWARRQAARDTDASAAQAP